MELEHSFTIPVSPQQAWQVLLDVQQVAPCMPGATVDSVEDDVIKGRIKVKVGPVALTYSGTARFTQRDDEALSVTLEASGKETRGSGTAKATVRSSLRDEGGQTRVVVHTTMSVTGRPAQFGRGVMAEVGGKLIEKFATNLAGQLAGGQPAASLAAVNGAGPGASVPGPAAAAASDSIEELSLPVRAYNSLRREGIHTVGDLSSRSERDLLAIENLGPQSLREIKQKLAERGFTLAPGEAPATGAAAQAAGDGSAPAPAAGQAERETGPTGPPPAPTPLRGPRPPDEEAIDLLSVAGFPVAKRVLPVAAVLAVLMLLFARIRGRRRRAAG